MSLHVNEWSPFVDLTPSTSPQILKSLDTICANGVQIDHQDDGYRIAFRIFGSKELIPYVRSWLKKEELQLHYPVDLEPSHPYYNPRETYQQTPQGNFDTSFWMCGTWYWREVPATIEIPEKIQEISSMDFYVELPSHSPPRKRQRLTSDGHKGQDNLPCSSTTVSVTTSDNTPIPTTSILTVARRLDSRLRHERVEIWQNVSFSDAYVDEEEEDVVIVPTSVTLLNPATKLSKHILLKMENELINRLDKEGMPARKIKVEVDLFRVNPIEMHLLESRLSTLRKTRDWAEKDIDALKKSHEDWVQRRGTKKVSPVTTIA
jgi:hypothetical protein